MMRLTLTECIRAMEVQPWDRPPTISVGGVSTDSRTVGADDLFFALPGERFDGHDYVVQALQAGAVGAVVATSRLSEVRGKLAAAQPAIAARVPVIGVDDTVVALGRLAAYHRQQTAAEVIAVVGSNGKTTTKAMIHHILAGRLRGRCSPKSFNNAIGVPLTLLSGEAQDEYLVVEVGTNAPGEVAQLGALVAPDLAVITCIGEEHLEGLGDLDGVAAEEAAILRFLRPKGFAAVNYDAPQLRPHIPAEGVHVATFGRHAEADVRVASVNYKRPWLEFTINERFPFRMPVPGAHNALNAVAAVTIARRFGVDYEEAATRLESFALPPMRNEIVEFGGITLINDAYNANPQSAAAAIGVLQQMPCRGRRIVVFGEMRELGARSADLHEQVADVLCQAKVDQVLLVGEAAGLMQEALSAGGLFGPAVERAADVTACVERLVERVQPGDVILLKGSRAVGLEAVGAGLRARLQTNAVT